MNWITKITIQRKCVKCDFPKCGQRGGSVFSLDPECSRLFRVRGGERQSRSTVAAAPRRAAPHRTATTPPEPTWAGLGWALSPGKLGVRVTGWVLLCVICCKLDSAPAALGNPTSDSSSSSGIVGGAPRRAAPHVLTRVFLGKLAVLVCPKRRGKATRQPQRKPWFSLIRHFELRYPGPTSAPPLTSVWERGRGAESGDV